MILGATKVYVYILKVPKISGPEVPAVGLKRPHVTYLLWTSMHKEERQKKRASGMHEIGPD